MLQAKNAAIATARRTLDLELAGLTALKDAIDDGLNEIFAAAIETIFAANGRVIVTGLGKSGHVGQKIAATMASTGTPAFFVHPSEASHGDLGMITSRDVILALSWSGETVELGSIISYSRRFAVPLIAITSKAESALGKAADMVLALPVAQEACPHGLAPTTSTTMQLAMGDCLAIALLERRGFSAADFKVFHPGGQLGANLKYASDIMHKGDRLPLAASGTAMSEALSVMTQKSFGCLGVVDAEGQLTGIITDGDLRRNMGPDLLSATVDAVMTRSPRTIAPDTLVSTALAMINRPEKLITALFVVETGKPVGILHIHDLLRIGVA
ncbi:MAG: KpsF/GutQ family sugar-phosphate isomerase [Alphaproteobacteria bacterium]